MKSSIHPILYGACIMLAAMVLEFIPTNPALIVLLITILYMMVFTVRMYERFHPVQEEEEGAIDPQQELVRLWSNRAISLQSTHQQRRMRREPTYPNNFGTISQRRSLRQ